MVEVRETAHIGLSAEAAWKQIGSFGAVGVWHPMLVRVDSEGDRPGARRHVKTKQGGRQVERLEAFDSQHHVYRYVMDHGALPVADYHGEFRVDGDGAGNSTVTWSARFEVPAEHADEGVETVRRFLKAGLDDLEKRYPPTRAGSK